MRRRAPQARHPYVRVRKRAIATALLALAASAAPVVAQDKALQEKALQEKAAPEKGDKPEAGRIGRVTKPSAPEFRAMYTFDTAAKSLGDSTFPYESRVHRAHVVMLAERGIIPRADAAAILKGLDAVDKRAATDGSLRTYLPYERALIETVGPVAGKLQTGRSRNDLGNTVGRMFYRDQVDRLVGLLIDLREALADQAEANRDTVMVAYTERKEAQPITLGHHLMAISESLGKTLTRYEQLRERIDQSPLGSAAVAGTSWPINRMRAAHLLGFPSIVENTAEGVGGWDHVAEFAAVDAICMTTLARFANEIEWWSSDEAGMVELDDSYAGLSSIMPQKKNPDSLGHVKEQAANALGALTAIVASLQGVEYQQTGARVPLAPRQIDAVDINLRVMTGVVRTLKPNPARMRQLAAEKFSTMTDLADELVRDGNIDFREAHEIVAKVVLAALAKGMTSDRIDLAMVQDAAKQQLGRTLPVNDQTLRNALDPTRSVARRVVAGGPAPDRVQAMIDETRAQDRAARERIAERQARLKAASDELNNAIAALEAG